VVLVDHFILRRRRADLAPRVALRWDTLLAWACGAIIYHLLANFWPEIGATLPALLLAGVLQLVFGSFSRGRERIAV
jgi:NCS1 family nucleobase:cation symporter-1